MTNHDHIITPLLSPDWCPIHGEGCECAPRVRDAADLVAAFATSEIDSLREMSELDWLEYLMAHQDDEIEADGEVPF